MTQGWDFLSDWMLRRFANKDAAQCCAIITDAIRTMDGLNDAARQFIFAKTTPDKLTAELQGFYTVVFEEDGEILGCGALTGNEIKRVYTTAHVRGRGIATAVMKALETEARHRNIDTIQVESALSSVDFYTKCGYTAVGPADDKIGDAEFHHIFMRKNLNDTKAENHDS